MHSLKIQVRANIANMYVEDDMITDGISYRDPNSVSIAVNRSLGTFLSKDTISNITRHIVNSLTTSNNTTNYKQILEQNIKGCYFRIYVKKIS